MQQLKEAGSIIMGVVLDRYAHMHALYRARLHDFQAKYKSRYKERTVLYLKLSEVTRQNQRKDIIDM